MSRRRKKRNGPTSNRSEAAPTITRRYRRRANQCFVAFSVLTLAIVGAYYWHLIDRMGTDIVVYASPTNSSATAWIASLRQEGFRVRIDGAHNASFCRLEFSLPSQVASDVCAVTAVPERYILSGYVPAGAVSRLLRDHLPCIGLASIEPPRRSVENSTSADAVPRVWAFWSDGRVEPFTDSK